MTKVSSNAGKHPYLRPENSHLFVHIEKSNGKKLLPQEQVKFNNISAETEFVDKKKKRLSYRDIVTLDKEDYEIGYNSREFYWNMVNLKDPKKTLRLSENAHLVVLKTKYGE